MSRHQSGYIWRKGRGWYGRWWEDVLIDGRVVRKQRARKLADYCDRYRSEKDVRPLLEEILRPLNTGRVSPESTLTIAEYVERYYLPHVEAEYKPSTVNGYRALWRTYLAPRLRQAVLRDYRCVDATNLLADIHRDHGIGRKTLRHCKGLLSSIFTFAKQQGVLDGFHPIKDAGIPHKAAASKPAHASSPDEVAAMLDALTGTARAAVALMYFCGLRPGEARGLQWADFNGRRLTVHQSVWHTHITTPKTDGSAASIPVCETLADILNKERRSTGYILSGPSGKPINLNNLSKRVVIPALKAVGLEWHGWYALRRGIATLTADVESPLAAKGLLRHSNLATTTAHYVKDSDSATARAMEKVDALFNQRATGAVN